MAEGSDRLGTQARRLRCLRSSNRNRRGIESRPDRRLFRLLLVGTSPVRRAVDSRRQRYTGRRFVRLPAHRRMISCMPAVFFAAADRSLRIAAAVWRSARSCRLQSRFRASAIHRRPHRQRALHAGFADACRRPGAERTRRGRMIPTCERSVFEHSHESPRITDAPHRTIESKFDLQRDDRPCAPSKTFTARAHRPKPTITQS